MHRNDRKRPNAISAHTHTRPIATEIIFIRTAFAADDMWFENGKCKGTSDSSEAEPAMLPPASPKLHAPPQKLLALFSLCIALAS